MSLIVPSCPFWITHMTCCSYGSYSYRSCQGTKDEAPRPTNLQLWPPPEPPLPAAPATAKVLNRSHIKLPEGLFRIVVQDSIRHLLKQFKILNLCCPHSSVRPAPLHLNACQRWDLQETPKRPETAGYENVPRAGLANAPPARYWKHPKLHQCSFAFWHMLTLPCQCSEWMHMGHTWDSYDKPCHG